jgi:hypothetical protein
LLPTLIFASCRRYSIQPLLLKKLNTASFVTSLYFCPQARFQEYIRPYFDAEPPRHLMLGSTFISNGVQFSTIACEPSNGVVDNNTEIFMEGDPLSDLAKLHLLPIYESLPNREKTIQPPELFDKYLQPYFAGRMCLVKKGGARDYF